MSCSLCKLLYRYIEIGLKIYKDDAVGMSMIILSSLTMVLLIDYLAGEIHPLFRNYNLEIPTTFLEYLVLPRAMQRGHLLKLEEYIK